MPKCLNADNKYYLGTEKSPKGLGYHASSELLNSEKIGLDNHVWHVVEFGPKKIKRWKKGQSNKSCFVYEGLILNLPAKQPGIGLRLPTMSPYSEKSWCCFNFEVVDDTHIKIIKNNLGIEMKPVTIQNFINLYKTVHGILPIENTR